jgi:glycosyltransferase involved in cell wall biosynthesis
MENHQNFEELAVQGSKSDHKQRMAPPQGRSVRIVLVLPGLNAGGSEHIVQVIANKWAERGWHVSILTLAAPGTHSYYTYDSRVTTHRLSLPPARRVASAAIWQALRRIVALRRAIRASNPQLVISFLSRTNVLTLLATRGLDLPVVVSERNNPELQVLGPVWSWLRARLYPRAFSLVTMTQDALEFFPEPVRRRGRVIPNAVELLPVTDRSRGDGNFLVAVGRLVPQKGFDLLLEAFAKVADDCPSCSLVVWGEGTERAQLERQRDMLGLNDRILLPGITDRPGAWVETADVFVLSSRYEGWGIVLLEAMGAGLPVVAFDCPWGPREMIDDGVNGILVPNGNVPALAAALTTLLCDAALRERLGAAARVKALSFTPERIIVHWDDLVEAALDPPGASSPFLAERNAQ